MKQDLRAREAALELAIAEVRLALDAVGDDTRHPMPLASSESTPRNALGQAQTLYKQRRLRDAHFSSYGVRFGEPTWDMLLDLFIATRTGTELNVSALAVGTGAPSTTALRHLAALEQRGLVVRTPASFDKRVSYVALSPEFEGVMERYFARITR